MRMFCPTVQPNCCKPCANAVRRACPSASSADYPRKRTSRTSRHPNSAAIADIRVSGFMECPESASPYCDVRRFDDRCPTSNLAFYQCCEWLLASPLFARNVAAEVGEALAYLLVIECLVECIRERVENRLRYALRRKQRPPRQRLKFRQAGLYCSWDIW